MSHQVALRVEEAARTVSISRSMAYHLVATGVWPSVRIGRAVRVPVAGLEKWLEGAQQGGAGCYQQ